ncbi:hypothetical protein FLAN108750_04600 [Flavobacterium antarcticum]
MKITILKDMLLNFNNLKFKNNIYLTILNLRNAHNFIAYY